jgi:hypothetical protein
MGELKIGGAFFSLFSLPPFEKSNFSIVFLSFNGCGLDLDFLSAGFPSLSVMKLLASDF